jgi:hypothetical protein
MQEILEQEEVYKMKIAAVKKAEQDLLVRPTPEIERYCLCLYLYSCMCVFV